MGELSGALNRDDLDVTQSRVGAEALAGLLARIADDTISGKIAKEVFEAMWSEGRDADAIIEAKGLKQITDTSAIEQAIDDGDGDESRSSSPSTARARTSCSASSSAR